MRVKKPQSKRKSTKLREGIKKKAAAHERKQKKLSKTDPTWKSRHKKDIGIPNSFPYKAQLLEEIEAKKLAAKSGKGKNQVALNNVDMEMGDDDDYSDDEMDVDTSNAQRLSALVASAEAAAAEYEETSGNVEQEFEVQDLAFKSDTSRKQFDKVYKQIVEMSDVIVYVLDARNPEETRSRQVEHAVLSNPEKRLIFVLNKADLIPTEVLKEWTKTLGNIFPTLPLIASHAAPNAKTFDHKALTSTATTNGLLQSLKTYAAASQLKRPMVVGIVGYPNVGKSSIINSLCARHGGRAKVCPVGAQAGVTTVLRKVKVDGKLSVVDSPGIVFPDENGESSVEKQAKLVLLNALPPKLIEDPQTAVSVLLKRLQKNPDQMARLQEYYSLPPIVMHPHSEFVKGFLIEVARNKGRLMKGGIPDFDSAAMAVITDWRDGRISGWSEPKPNTSSADQTAQESKKIVAQWSQEFSLEGLWDGQVDADC